MSRRNTDAITIHSILDWIEDNLESPLSLEKVSERSGYSKFDVPPHKYRITNMHGESRYMLPLNHGNY
ncbi:hypothetical protein M1U27_000751 [Salmonella enterica]|nr:hypothetical protein [Salmonella enterica]